METAQASSVIQMPPPRPDPEWEEEPANVEGSRHSSSISLKPVVDALSVVVDDVRREIRNLNKHVVDLQLELARGNFEGVKASIKEIGGTLILLENRLREQEKFQSKLMGGFVIAQIVVGFIIWLITRK